MPSAQELEVVFIPGPGMGHVVSVVEFALLLLSRETRVSMTLLLVNDPSVREYINGTRFQNPRLRFHTLPEVQFETSESDEATTKTVKLVLAHIPLVRDALATLTSNPSTRVVGFVADMFCTCMFDVANEFSIPNYLFFTSGAGFLSLMFSMQALVDHTGLVLTELRGSDQEFNVSGFMNPFPAKVLPTFMMDEGASKFSMAYSRKYRELSGIFINTFEELEPNVIKSLSNPVKGDKIPPVYPVGPLINFNSKSDQEESKSSDIITWLDQQPPCSVVFLCFGSQGTFSDEQIKHIATALESSGHRFLWSLRRRKEASFDSTIIDDVLLEGFLERTKGIGKVIGWAPQTVVLSHAAVGGFVSHCGWNSTLESMWFGVPMAAWPLYAEQQGNAFQLVKEMGVAVEIRMDYREAGDIVVSSEEIEAAIQKMMEGENGVRERANKMREKSIKALEDGGSSHKFVTNLVDDILRNSPAKELI